MSQTAEHEQPAGEGQPPSVKFVGETLSIDSAPSSHELDKDATFSSTTSLSSSVTDFRMEYGRRYHAFNDDAYWLPNDEEEMSRLELQHVVWQLCLNGRLHMAPLPAEIKRVADLGTGTGKWAIDFADAHPDVQVIGTDLSPIQPSHVPPNCSFFVENIEDEWAFRELFDYIHGRALILGIHDWSKYFRQCFDNLKPGGWCEIQEPEISVRSANPDIQDDWPLKAWGLHLIQAVVNDGIDPDPFSKFRAMMEEIGFVNVKEKPLQWPVGPWAKGKREKLIGRIMVDNSKLVCRPVATALFTKRLGWSIKQVEEFIPAVEKDITNFKRLYYLPLRIFIGQKPE